MTVIFEPSEQLKAVVDEALSLNSSILFVKDQGVYILPQNGKMDETGEHIKNICFAEGLNPADGKNPDWYSNARSACGGDDFVETLDREQFELALQLQKPVSITVSPTELEISVG